ncbi:MAG: hypothetical protein ABSD38_10525 [Syntrophorhabdales bacterium]|jgi:hypothetical protein
MPYSAEISRTNPAAFILLLDQSGSTADKMPACSLLGGPGFDYVIDAGLGATARDYRKFRVEAFNHSQRQLGPCAYLTGGCQRGGPGAL